MFSYKILKISLLILLQLWEAYGNNVLPNCLHSSYIVHQIYFEKWEENPKKKLRYQKSFRQYLSSKKNDCLVSDIGNNS